jgi:tRNA1Val (adenine37-N6)-methyltransferase
VGPRADEDLSYLTGDWRLLQKKQGHRWSLDDLVTAWFAARQCETPPQRFLDLGCGIGSVLLMTAWRFPSAAGLGVEAQPVSFELCERSIRYNGANVRVELGDFRARAFEPLFDLVTGTPPYFPPGTGTESNKVQAAPARFEHRGGVEAYCEAMQRALRPGGVGVLCAGVGQMQRMGIEPGLLIEPKRGKPPLLAVYVLGKNVEPRTLVVRERDGQWTDVFLRVREDMGMPGRP